MFRIYSDTTVFILCPLGLKSGGIESLHQLGASLINLKFDCRMVYLSGNSEQPLFYKNYNIPIADYVDDVERNILIIPEIFPEELKKYKFIQKAIWWLSVDYCPYKKRSLLTEFWKSNLLFTLLNKIFPSLCFNELYKQVKLRPIFDFKSEVNLGVINLAGSEYAYTFLLKYKAKNLMNLSSGPVNDVFHDDSSKEIPKEDLILFNPSKGKQIIDKFRGLDASLKWIPIENMTSHDIRQLMLRAKVYVDFGHFPGKERMPREAVMSNCCIIVGNRGAGKFYQNIPIPSKYKFDIMPINYEEVIHRIKECLNNYDGVIDDFQQFRRLVLKEKSLFEIQIEQIFGNNN